MEKKSDYSAAWIKSIDRLQMRLGYEFKNPSLLTHALMHPSWANEHQMDELNNQRLEFLGDAVLELCISDELYQRYPALREGKLTETRSRLVSERELAKLASSLNLGSVLLLGKGEENNGARKRDSTLADAFEAVLAAIYKDGGIEAARNVMLKLYQNEWEKAVAPEKKKDAKSSLQELCQKLFKKLPVYARIGESGPEHEKMFEVCLTLPDGSKYHGRDKSARLAEHAAAASALAQLEVC